MKFPIPGKTIYILNRAPVSDYTCNAKLLGHLQDAGSEWSDASCALIHGPVTGIRIWTESARGYVTRWVSNNNHDIIIIIIIIFIIIIIIIIIIVIIIGNNCYWKLLVLLEIVIMIMIIVFIIGNNRSK